MALVFYLFQAFLLGRGEVKGCPILIPGYPWQSRWLFSIDHEDRYGSSNPVVVIWWTWIWHVCPCSFANQPERTNSFFLFFFQFISLIFPSCAEFKVRPNGRRIGLIGRESRTIDWHGRRQKIIPIINRLYTRSCGKQDDRLVDFI